MGIHKNYCPAFVQWALTQLLPAPASTAQHPLRARGVHLSAGPIRLRVKIAQHPLVRVKLESALVLTPSVLKLSYGAYERESLFPDRHPTRIGDERERLVTASPVMTKSWGPGWGKRLPEERPRETAETCHTEPSS
jgi:hypothetical protein